MNKREVIPVEKYAAIYIRVSTDYQAEEGYSIDAQKEQLTAYCIAKGIKNYQYYIDGGWSGSNLKRPAMQRLIMDAKAGKLSHCFVYKLDRLSRSQRDTLYLIEDIFDENNVDFISLTESFDTSTQVGKLIISILSAFAQLERENIRMRTRMGMLERVKAGYWMGGGRVPFGFDYDAEQGILVHNADTPKVVKMYELYLNGYAIQTIATMLGLRYERLVYQILTRKTNYGIIEYRGVEYKGLHEPIITKETYDAAMAEMQKRSTTAVTSSNYLLTGLLRCKICGAKIRYQKWGKYGAKLVCYSQQTSKPYLVKDPRCTLPRYWASDIEDLVLKQVFTLQPKEVANDNTNTSDFTKILQTQKLKEEQKLKRLYNLYAENEDGDETLLSSIGEVKRKLASLGKQLELEEKHNIAAANVDKFNESVKNLQSAWGYMTFAEKQHVIRSIVSEVQVGKDELSIKLCI